MKRRAYSERRGYTADTIIYEDESHDIIIEHDGRSMTIRMSEYLIFSKVVEDIARQLRDTQEIEQVEDGDLETLSKILDGDESPLMK